MLPFSGHPVAFGMYVIKWIYLLDIDLNDAERRFGNLGGLDIMTRELVYPFSETRDICWA